MKFVYLILLISTQLNITIEDTIYTYMNKEQKIEYKFHHDILHVKYLKGHTDYENKKDTVDVLHFFKMVSGYTRGVYK
jgi:hypothetical protein